MQNVSDELLQNGEPSTKQIKDHPILNLWFKETMRIQNPTPGIFSRIAKQDTSIGDIIIRKGDAVSITFSGLNFDEKVYAKPNEFQLERFAKETEVGTGRYQYCPFSIGKRICMGRHMAELMVKLFVVYFLHMYEFHKPEDTVYFEGFSIVNHITNPFIMAKLRK